MTVTRHSVVVVGAGPVGMATAILLADRGVDCLVVDRWSDVYPQPRAVHLDDEVCRILSRLGLADDFARISRPAHGLRLVDAGRSVLAQFTRSPGAGVHGFPQANLFDQPELEKLLRAGLARREHCTFRGGVEVIDVANTREGARVTMVDSVTGTRETAHAASVLGCDGANSVVRSSIGTGMEELGPEQRWLVVDIATDRDLGHWDGVHQVCDPQRAATFMRIGPTRYRWEFRLLPGESARRYGDLPALYPLLAPWIQSADPGELDVVRVAEYTFCARVALRWRDRRIFLLGDAAHLTPPFIGQGLGAGFRDADNLAWKLAGVLRGGLSASHLDSFEQERRPHARAMVRLAVAMGWAMTSGGHLGGAVRRRVVPLAVRIPSIGSKIIEGVTPPLAASRLVHRAPVRGGLAGSLCPNVTVGEDLRRLDDVAEGAVVVVTVVEPTAGQRAEIERRGARVIRPAAGSDLHRWLTRGGASAAVVRPDGTVLCAARSLAGVYTRIPVLTST